MKILEIELDEFDEQILKHDIVDVKKWVQDALLGKINNVTKRALKECQTVLINDPEITSIPATVSGSLSLWFSRPYYQNKEQRLSGSLDK